jgi:REP element-mobilizing transposase RayT
MGYPRSVYVPEGQDIVCHTFTRCVRRAHLYGYDALTNRDYSHRKAWIVERLRFLTTIFAVEVCTYSVLDNHYHLVLRILPSLVDTWSDRDVAIRWITLSPRQDGPPIESQITAITAAPKRVAQLRRRLGSLSWFMSQVNGFISRKANKEDGVKGRFWESRFKCRALLDDAAIVAGMVYVDLNPIRAGLAGTPEDSDFTSIQERIRAWQKENMPAVESPGAELQASDYAEDCHTSVDSSSWLCPIGSDSHHRGILQITTAQYIDLVDRSGRILKTGKSGFIDPDLAPILLRIGANPNAWFDTLSGFDSSFRIAAGLLSSLRTFARQLGRRWVIGVTAAKMAFST